ncbi:MAG: galactokinase [Nocardioides sp.]
MGDVSYVDPGTTSDSKFATTRGFQRAFEFSPERVGRAPGRVNLIGEHTDYNRGLCLPIALPHATYAAIRRRDDEGVRIASSETDEAWEGKLDQLGPGQERGWWSYVSGVLWAFRRTHPEMPARGIDVYVHSTVPIGAGLSSSAALEAAAAIGLWSVFGLDAGGVNRAELVESCIAAETEIAGAPTGGMDQSAAILSRPGRALLMDFEKAPADRADHVDLQLRDAGLELLVVDSGVSHALVDGAYGDRRADCQAAAAALGLDSLRDADEVAVQGLSDPRLRKRARHVVTEIARVRGAVAAFADRDFERVGQLFGESHVSLRDDFEVSCGELDLIVETLSGSGALGARMTGGGFGGSAVALLPRESVGAAAESVQAAAAGVGHPVPRFLSVSPSTPAEVV